jgi:hypothetical protein
MLTAAGSADQQSGERGRGTRGSMPVYARSDWSKGFDIVIHNECLADVPIPTTFVRSPPVIRTDRRLW